jgi:hypothetical protein
VLDQFSAGVGPRISFSPAEFSKDGVRDIWKHIASGQIKNVRWLISLRSDKSLRVDEYSEYGVDSLGGTTIELSEFPTTEFSKLFFELFRFARTIPYRKQAVPLDTVRRAYQLEIDSLSWKASLLREYYLRSLRYRSE